MDGYVWFDGVRVESDGGYGVHCIVNGRRVPLPVAILHPDCTLRGHGDVGRLGVPRAWAVGWGLMPPAAPAESD